MIQIAPKDVIGLKIVLEKPHATLSYFQGKRLFGI
jgi:hypothetical protein